MKRNNACREIGRSAEAEIDAEVSELNGWSLIGNKKETLAIARSMLKARPVRPARFAAAMETVVSEPQAAGRCWTVLAESAYCALGRKADRSCRVLMFRFYAKNGEWAKARDIMPRRNLSALDLMAAMSVLVELKDSTLSKSIARTCFRRLGQTDDDTERSLLLDALARYYAFRGELKLAEACCLASPNVPVMFRGKIFRLIELAAVRAWELVIAGLVGVEEIRTLPDPDAITAPEDTSKYYADTEEQLLRWKRALERIVPADELWRYGVEFIQRPQQSHSPGCASPETSLE